MPRRLLTPRERELIERHLDGEKFDAKESKHFYLVKRRAESLRPYIEENAYLQDAELLTKLLGRITKT